MTILSGAKPIQLLPAELADRIAAGEVVESPSSVVKELVENALDAGSTKIEITAFDAGFSAMGVADNGTGMGRENLAKCILRHATSKITRLEDLCALSSMGFRGEALASAGAVSRLEIVSADTADGLGYRLRCDGGVVVDTNPVARAQGTTVKVRDLFYNTPARKKFMKSARSERMNLVRTVEQLAIPFPSVHFSLVIDQKQIFDLPFAANEVERIAQLAGPEFARSLVACRGTFDDSEAVVYVTRPDQARPRPRYQYLYVNLRRIDNDSVHFAIRNAYRDFIMGDYKPSFFCFVSIDPHRIDVNIHPTKQKLKFDDESRVFGCVHTIVKNGLREALNPVEDIRAVTGSYRSAPDHPQAPGASSAIVSNGVEEQCAESAPPERDSQVVLRFPSVDETLQKSDGLSEEQTVQLFENDSSEHWNLINCFQIHGLYIIAPIKNGVMLVDQHAAHERILFEQALDDFKRGSSASQQLLFPLVVELNAEQKTLIESGMSFFSAFGYEVDDFGGGTVSVSAIPAFLKNAQAAESIREMLDFLVDNEIVKNFPEPHRRFAAAFACGSAIKAGQELTAEEMNALLNALFATRNPYTCPHGRPTVVRLSMAELKRRFLR